LGTDSPWKEGAAWEKNLFGGVGMGGEGKSKREKSFSLKQEENDKKSPYRLRKARTF